MIAISDDILINRFNSGLLRGNLLRTLFAFSTKTKFKRLLLLNTNFDSDDILFFFTTASIKWYIDNKESDLVKNNCIFINMGGTVNNPEKDIVINCRKVYVISKSILFDNYKNKKLDFLDKFPDGIMSKVDSIIRDSKLIAPKYLLKII